MTFKIIYVDDESDICEDFALLMESDSIQVITFTSPFELLQKIDSINPDIIVSDYRMPGLTGIELAQKLSPELPKVLLTGELSLKDTSDFIKVFQKPCDFRALRTFLYELEAKKTKDRHHESR